MIQTKAKLIDNKRVKDNYWHAAFHSPAVAKQASPGQFVNIRLSDDYEPLLRRPLSIHRVKGASLQVLYEVIGKGTEILSRKKPGGLLDIIGPLGNGFAVSGERLAVIVAGGMGVAPLMFLAETLAQSTMSNSPCLPGRQAQSIVLIGAGSRDQILCAKEFKELGFDVKIATDDGSQGFKGKVTELLGEILGFRVTGNGERTPYPVPRTPIIYACGPHAMLKEISLLSKKYKIPAQVSLDEHMACGIGACLGCVVKTHDPRPTTHDTFEYKRICKDGPVFNAEEIIW